mmetsp:Transcript_25013/g.48932  ORF Transcript_25013/g.48932 Transcript_25013/m.48932 type:complete len:374 (-) Transcript_25013:218-1339(-)
MGSGATLGSESGATLGTSRETWRVIRHHRRGWAALAASTCLMLATIGCTWGRVTPGILGKQKLSHPGRRKFKDDEPVKYGRIPARVLDELKKNNGTIVFDDDVPEGVQMPPHIKEGFARERRRVDFQGKTPDERKLKYKTRQMKFRGDRLAADEELANAAKALEESKLKKAITHYRMALVQYPNDVLPYLGIIETMRKLPERNLTAEIEEGVAALDCAHRIRNMRLNVTALRFIIRHHLENRCQYIVEKHNGTTYRAKIDFLKKLQKGLDMPVKYLDQLRPRIYDFSYAAETKRIIAQGLDPDEEWERRKSEIKGYDSEGNPISAEDEADEDELEIIRQQEYEKWDKENQKLKLFALDTKNLIMHQAFPVGIA